MFSDGFKPCVVKKLTGPCGAGPFVLCIRVTIRFDCDNALDQSLNANFFERLPI